MIKAVIFDMFETLVTLFAGRTYFSEDIAKDLGVPLPQSRQSQSNSYRTCAKKELKPASLQILFQTSATLSEKALSIRFLM